MQRWSYLVYKIRDDSGDNIPAAQPLMDTLHFIALPTRLRARPGIGDVTHLQRMKSHLVNPSIAAGDCCNRGSCIHKLITLLALLASIS